MIKSPLRYPGGKSRAVKFLTEYIPPFEEYREVFFGGGSLLIHLAQMFPDKKFAASDINYELFCFWNELKKDPQSLTNAIDKEYHKVKSKKSPDAGKRLFNEILSRRNDKLTELQRAIDFFMLNRITFSGVVDSGGYSKASFDSRFTASAVQRVRHVAEIIQDVKLFCRDYSYLLNKKGKDVFVFLDPPYYSATKSKLYGKNGILHVNFNHEKLAEELKKCKHQWMITYDDSPFIRNLYKDYFQLKWQLQYGMTNSNKAVSRAGNELLIANYDLKSVRAK